jgi:hypothetical protein
MTMRIRSCLLALSLVAACGGDDDGVTDANIIRLDDASEEVMFTIAELVDRGEVTVDDEVAAALTAPADGAELPSDAAPTFSWSPRVSTVRHGRTTGDFVWLHLECPGMDAAIDVVAIDSTEWEPDADRWAQLQTATGACEVQVVSAYADRGIVTEGPFVPSSNPTFSVSE